MKNQDSAKSTDEIINQLLEALKLMVATANPSPRVYSTYGMEEAIAKARAAISKAEGKE